MDWEKKADEIIDCIYSKVEPSQDWIDFISGTQWTEEQIKTIKETKLPPFIFIENKGEELTDDNDTVPIALTKEDYHILLEMIKKYKYSHTICEKAHQSDEILTIKDFGIKEYDKRRTD